MVDNVTSLGVSVDTRGARTSVRGLRTDLDRLTDSGERASAQSAILSRTLAAAGATLAAYASAQSISTLVRDAAQLEGINSRIASLTGDLASSQDFLRASAQELSAEYVTLANGYSKLLPLFDAGVLSLEQAQEVTRGLANVQAITGASSVQLGQSVFGLAQGLSAGTLRAEELNQVTEPLPGLLQALDRAAGLAGGGFRRMVVEGKVTSDFFRDTLLVALEEYEGAAASLSGNITQTLNRTRNAYTEVVAAFSEPIAAGATGVANELTDILNSLAENAEEVVTGIQLIGGAVALAFGGSALTSVSAYASSLSVVGQRTTALNAIQRGAIGTSNLEAVARLASAQATARGAAESLKETTAIAASLPVKQRALFIETEVAAAKKLAETATLNLVRAETAAIAVTGRLSIAQRAAAVSATALGAAQTAASGAMALVGGPVGAALLAAGGLAFLATRQSEAEQSAESLREVIENLNIEFAKSPEVARQAAQSAIAVVRAQVNEARQQLADLKQDQEELASGVGGRSGQAAAAESRRESQRLAGQIREQNAILDEAIDKLDELNQAQNDVSFTSWPDRVRQNIQDASAAIAAETDSVREALDAFFPEREKLESLDVLRQRLLALEGTIPVAEFEAGIAALDRQERSVRSSTSAAREAARVQSELQSVLSEALPERAALDEQAEKLEALDRAYNRGQISLELYNNATASLSDQFRDEALQTAAEKVQDITDALNDRAQTPFSAYADEIELLNRAMDELPDRAGDLAGNIERAFANLDFEVRANLTVVQGDSVEELNRSFDEQLAALDEFHAARDVSEAQANADRLDLAASFGDQLVDANRSVIERVNDLSNVSEGIQFEFDVQTDQIELARLLRDGVITQQEFQSIAIAQEIEHQEALSDIVRRGEGTRLQIQQASALDRISNFLNRNDEEIEVFGNITDQLIQSEEERQNRRSEIANNQLSDDQARYDEALKAFEDSGTEQNRIALEQAETQLAISEANAKRQFEREKRYSIAQAVLAQGLTVAQAFADPSLSALQKFGVAAASALQVATAIRSIKSASFDSGSASTSIGSADTGSTSIGTNTSSTTASQSGQNINVFNLNGVLALDQDQVIAQSVKKLADDGYILDANLNNLNTQNISVQTVNVQ